MISQTEENYLKAIFSLSQEKNEVTANQISKHLNIKMPTVNSMMKRLAEKNLVNYESYKPIKLSEEGAKKAKLIVRKHRLTEMFLVEKMGFSWDEVHPIAEQIEHIQSEIFFNKMDEILDYPDQDPHGSPIPNSNGDIPLLNYRKLSKCLVGEKVKVSAIGNSSEEFLKFLKDKNIYLGLLFSIVNIEEYDGSMDIKIDERPTITLSKIVCDKIMVR